jgi:hypothetical protein
VTETVGDRAGSGSEVVLTHLRRRRSWLVIVGVAALIARLPAMVVAHSVGPGDSAGYVDMAEQIGHGRYVGMFRTPGYPAFVWLCSLLPGSTADGVAITQHLIGIALAVGVTAFGWRVLSPIAGVVAGTIAAISVPQVAFEDVILADFLFGALVLAGTVVFAACVRPGRVRVRTLVAAGTLFAAATYVKPVGQALILVAPVVVGIASRDLRKTARASGVVGLTMVLLLGPWAIRNAVVNDDFALTNQLGVTLFNRAFEVEGLPIPADDPQSALVRRLVATAEREPGLRPSSYVVDELIAHHGFNAAQALAIQRRLAVTAIRRHAFTYVKTSAKLVRTSIQDLHAEIPPPDGERRAPGIIRRPGHWLTSVGDRLAGWWWTLTGGVLAALVLLLVPGPRRRAALAVGVPPLLVTVATVLTHGGNVRYAFQAAPEAWLLGSAGLALIVRAVVGHVRRARRAARPVWALPDR